MFESIMLALLAGKLFAMFRALTNNALRPLDRGLWVAAMVFFSYFGVIAYFFWAPSGEEKDFYANI